MADLTQTQLEFVEWMANPTRDGSQAAWAQAHGVAEETCRRWKKTDWYREHLEARMRELHLSTDKVMEVVHAMQKQAAAGDVSAAKTYLAFLERVQPFKQTQEDDRIEDMSDEELERAWREAVG